MFVKSILRDQIQRRNGEACQASPMHFLSSVIIVVVVLLIFTSTVNICGHFGMVSKPNHTFSGQALTY